MQNPSLTTLNVPVVQSYPHSLLSAHLLCLAVDCHTGIRRRLSTGVLDYVMLAWLRLWVYCGSGGLNPSTLNPKALNPKTLNPKALKP